jgi:flagellar hook-basal body complex protein FliE
MTPTAAANAYASIAQQIGSTAQSGKTASAVSELSGATPDGFAGLVREAIEATTQQAQQADQVAAQGVVGNADIVDVVTAISETELTIETIVGLRDRVIGAYESIMRMPI